MRPSRSQKLFRGAVVQVLSSYPGPIGRRSLLQPVWTPVMTKTRQLFVIFDYVKLSRLSLQPLLLRAVRWDADLQVDTVVIHFLETESLPQAPRGIIFSNMGS